MTYTEADRKYENDASFRAVVDSMVGVIHHMHLTPAEMREACLYACIRFEQINIRPLLVRVDPRARKELEASRDRIASLLSLLERGLAEIESDGR